MEKRRTRAREGGKERIEVCPYCIATVAINYIHIVLQHNYLSEQPRLKLPVSDDVCLHDLPSGRQDKITCTVILYGTMQTFRNGRRLLCAFSASSMKSL